MQWLRFSVELKVLNLKYNLKFKCISSIEMFYLSAIYIPLWSLRN